MSKLNLKAFKPDLPPGGRIVRMRTMEPGDPKASRITTVRLGVRPDRRDFNPNRCLAKRKGRSEQCGRLPVKGYVVCAVHGAGSQHRQRNGEKLPPVVSGALGTVVRNARRGRLDLAKVADFFPAVRKKMEEYRENPERLAPREDQIRLSALQDVLLSGEIETDIDFVVKAVAALSVAKSNAARAEASLRLRQLVPMERVNKYLRRLMVLCEQYIPRERHEAFSRELKVIADEARADPARKA